MEIVEITDKRYKAFYSRRHLLGRKNYFFISANLKNYKRDLLIWPGEEIIVRRAFSNKRLSRIKTTPINLAKDSIRFVIGRFGELDKNWMYLKEEESPDYWTLVYSPAINVRVMNEIVWILQRLKI